MITDANPNALDLGLDVSILFIELCENSWSFCDSQEKILSSIVDKTFGARQSTLQRGKALILKIIETTDPNQMTTFLLSKLNDKKPKVPGMCLDLLTEGLILFGAYNYPIKEMLKAIPAVFNSSNSSARESAMSLIVEIHRWIGLAPLSSLLEGLRPAQKTDFEKLIAAKAEEATAAGTSGAPVPSLGLKKDRESGELERQQQKALNSNNAKVDSREFIEEVDLSKKLKGSDFYDLVASEKWADQAQGLDLLIATIGPAPKLKFNSTIHDILEIIHKLLKDSGSHIAVQIKCLKLIGMFADGSRNKVSQEMRNIISTIIVQKSKEKKLSQEILDTSLVIFQHCVTFDHLLDDIIELLVSKKSPSHCKVCLSQIIEGIIDRNVLSNADSWKVLYSSFLTNCDDSDPKVREMATKNLSKIYSFVVTCNDKPIKSQLMPLFNTLQSTNAKLHKRITTETTSSSSSSEPPAAASSLSTTMKKPPSTATVAASSDNNSVTSDLSSTRSMPALKQSSVRSSQELTSNTSSKISSAKPSASSASLNKTIKVDKKEDVKDDGAGGSEEITISFDEVVTQLSQSSDFNWEVISAQLASAKWQDKVEGMTTLQNKINPFLLSLGEGLFVVFSHYGIWKSSNVNILKAAIDFFASFSSFSETRFSKALSFQCIDHLLEKLADKKLQKPVETLYENILVLHSKEMDPKTFLRKLSSLIPAAKSPLVHSNILTWMKTVFASLRNNQVPLPVIGQLCLKEMENKNGSIRSAALELLCFLYSRIGPPLASVLFTKDVSPQLKVTIENEFSKVQYVPPSSSTAGDGDDANGDLDIPRKDLSELLDKSTFNDMNNLEGKDSWQIRKAAMEKILEGCNASGHYLEFNKTSIEAIKSLKQRLADTQSNLKILAVQVLSHLIASFSLDKAVKGLKPVVSPMLLGLNDNKKMMRDATIAGLDTIITLNGSQPKGESTLFMIVFSSCTEVLTAPIGRFDLLSWFNTHCECFSGDCNELTPLFVTSLQDKTSQVRLECETLFIYLVSHRFISKSSFEKATRDLSPATQRSLQGVLDKIAAAFPSSSHHPTLSHGNHHSHSSASLMRSDHEGGGTMSKGATPPPSPSRSVGGDVSHSHHFSSSSPAKPLAFPPPPPLSSKSDRKSSGDWSKWPSPPIDPTIYDLAILKKKWRSDYHLDDKFLADDQSLSSALHVLLSSSSSSDASLLISQSDLIFRFLSYQITVTKDSGKLGLIVRFLVDFFHRINQQQHSYDNSFDEEEVLLFLPHLMMKLPFMKEDLKHQLNEFLSSSSIVSFFPVNSVFNIVKNALSLDDLFSRLVIWNIMESFVQNFPDFLSSFFSIDDLSKIQYLKNNHNISSQERETISHFISSTQRLNSSESFTTFLSTLQMLVNDSQSQQPQQQSHQSLPMKSSSVSKSASSSLHTNSTKGGNSSFFFLLLDELLIINSSSSAIPVTKSREIADYTRIILSASSEDETMTAVTTRKVSDFLEVISQIFKKSAKMELSILYCCSALLHYLCKRVPSFIEEININSIRITFTSLLEMIEEFSARQQQGNDEFSSLWKAVNMILVKFSITIQPVLGLAILFELLSSPSRGNQHQHKVVVRLILNILDHHQKISSVNSLIKSSSDDMLLLLLDKMNLLLSKGHNPDSISTSIRLVKTVYQIIYSIIGEERMENLNFVGGIPFEYLKSSGILSSVSEKEQASHDVENNANSKGEQIVKIINEITFSKDKGSAVAKLHSFKISHPEVDLNIYLSRLSTPFQKYVFDIFAKLEETENKKSYPLHIPSSDENSVNNITNSQYHASAASDNYLGSMSGTGIPSSSSSDTVEAFKIIENLKYRPNSGNFKQSGPPELASSRLVSER
jgi:hypothetical protein